MLEACAITAADQASLDRRQGYEGCFRSDARLLRLASCVLSYHKPSYARANTHGTVTSLAVCTRAQLLLSQEDDRTTVISSTSDSSQERMRQRALIEAQGRLKVS